jgi:hypothetical protein
VETTFEVTWVTRCTENTGIRNKETPEFFTVRRRDGEGVDRQKRKIINTPEINETVL